MVATGGRTAEMVNSIGELQLQAKPELLNYLGGLSPRPSPLFTLSVFFFA